MYLIRYEFINGLHIMCLITVYKIINGIHNDLFRCKLINGLCIMYLIAYELY